MNIAFFSSSALAIPLLNKLNEDFAVKLVITNPDKPIGRKQTLTPSALKTWAIKNKVDFLTPTTLKSFTPRSPTKRDEVGPNFLSVVEQIKALNIDLAIVIDYGLLIPKTIFTAPPLQTINLHFSLLPKYRGPNPDSFVILNGEKRTGISFVLIDEGFDTGDILAQKEVEVLPTETAGELHQRLYQETEKLSAYIINSWAKWYLDKKNTQSPITNHQPQLFLPPKKQNNNSATYTKKLSREDGFIEWKKLLNASTKLFNFYRALSPWPGIWTLLRQDFHLRQDYGGQIGGQAKRLKILKSHLEKEKFVIDEVQLEGKKPTSWELFKKAYIHI